MPLITNHLDLVRRVKFLTFRLNESYNLDSEKRDKYKAELKQLLTSEMASKIDFNDSMRIYSNHCKRTQRVRQKIGEMTFFNPCSFLTLTFTDDVLQSTSIDTRRRYVSRFLKSISSEYVANIDFGKKNDREHYHAVVVGQDLDLTGWDKYGFSNAKKITVSDSSNSKLSKYINKLANHATKDTTKQIKIIYSTAK